MNSILQNVLKIIVPFTARGKLSVDKQNGQSLVSVGSNVQPTSTPYMSYKQDIKSFGELMMRHVQNGTLTQEALDNAIEEHKKGISADNVRKRQAIVDGVDSEIKDIYESLPESQRQRFKDNIDRQARIDSKLKTIVEVFSFYPDENPLSWQASLIANIVKDPELEKLASSISTKETLTGAPYVPTYSMDAYADNPLSEPLIALRAQRADTRQAFVTEMIERKNESITKWTLNNWFYESSPNTTHKDDAHVLGALEKMGLPNKNTSELISNALLATGIPMLKLGKFSSYLGQLTPEDSTKIKSHYVQEFAQGNVVEGSFTDNPLVNHWGFSTRLREIEFLLNNVMPSGTPDDKTTKSFEPESLEKKTTVARLADVLLPFYDIDTVATMLESYQGNLALDGSLSSKDLISDVRAYLNERTNTGPNAPENTFEVLRPFIFGTATADMSAMFVQFQFDEKMKGWSLPSIEQTEKFAADAKAAGIELPNFSFDTDMSKWWINISEEALAKAKEQLNYTPSGP